MSVVMINLSPRNVIYPGIGSDMMTDVDSIIRGSVLATANGPGPLTGKAMREIGTIDDPAIAVEDGHIVDIGPASDIGSEYSGRVIDLDGCTLVPGFVDPHTHALFAGTRADEVVMRQEGWSYLEVLKAGGGILRTMRAVREATDGELIMETLLRLDRMLSHGTTTAEIKTGYDLRPEGEVRLLEVINSIKHPMTIVPTFLGAHAVPPEYDDPSAYVDCLIEVLPEAANLARFCDVFCEDGVFDVEVSRRLLEAAIDAGMGVKMHADEIEPIGGAGLAASLGARSAEHLLAASDGDLKAMADAGVVAVLLPGTSYVLMKGKYADARKMIEMEIPVALATDINPNCWMESMQMVMSLAAYQMKMHPDECLTAATLNAAHALDLSERTGSLEVGKWADIVAIDAPDHMHIPYRFGSNHVRAVIKMGEVVVDRSRTLCD